MPEFYWTLSPKDDRVRAMYNTLAFRALVATGLLVTACAQPVRGQDDSAANAEGGVLLDADHVTAEFPVGGGGKTGMDHALLMTQQGIFAAWLSPIGEVRQRFFADGHDAEIGLGSRDPMRSFIGLPDDGSASFQQLLLVGNQTLLVARAVRYGVLTGSNAVRVAALTSP